LAEHLALESFIVVPTALEATRTRMLALVLFLSISTGTGGFVVQSQSRRPPASLVFAGKGFEKNRESQKTYGEKVVAPIKDLIDTESAMNQFFSSNEEWKPLFRSMVAGPSVPAMSFIGDVDVTDFKFEENTSPWKRLDAIPTNDFDRGVLADFLDNMQASLLDIPVDETTDDDENDLQFLEEGRRLLVCGRFHVLQGNEKGSIESYSSLFSACWNEITQLKQADESGTGSLIVVPGCDLDDLRRFADMNLQRPLQWLGIDSDFEVASLQRGSPAIRLIHKLEDMPTDIPTEPETTEPEA
jgi:hypothetical protein